MCWSVAGIYAADDSRWCCQACCYRLQRLVAGRSYHLMLVSSSVCTLVVSSMAAAVFFLIFVVHHMFASQLLSQITKRWFISFIVSTTIYWFHYYIKACIKKHSWSLLNFRKNILRGIPHPDCATTALNSLLTLTGDVC